MNREREKLCLFCKHFYLDVGSPGYSEYTPGSDFSMECRKQHWDFGGVRDTELHYRECIISAGVCPDYELDESLANIEPAYEAKAKRR